MNIRIRSSILSLLFVGVAAVPTLATAQSVGQSTPVLTMQPILTNLPSVGTGAPLGASIRPVGVTSKMAVAPVSLTQSMANGEHVGSNRAMMGAGAVAIIVGLIIGGDVGTLIAVGGAIFALVGLYRYMR